MVAYSDFGIYAEAVAAKVRRNNAERRAAWRYRVCAGIDAARRDAPIAADELRERVAVTSENRRGR